MKSLTNRRAKFKLVLKVPLSVTALHKDFTRNDLVEIVFYFPWEFLF